VVGRSQVGPGSGLGQGPVGLGFWVELGSSWVRLEELLKAKAKSGLSFKITCYSFGPRASPKWPRLRKFT
jgi:hypothetical protein